jgi:hypothetical protein
MVRTRLKLQFPGPWVSVMYFRLLYCAPRIDAARLAMHMQQYVTPTVGSHDCQQLLA